MPVENDAPNKDNYYAKFNPYAAASRENSFGFKEIWSIINKG